MEERDQGTRQSGLETTSPTKFPTRVITYAWGDSYIADLVSLTIPALLAPGNLPYLASQVSCEVVILTEERFFACVGQSPAVQRLRAICPFRLIGLDDLITAPDKKYGMALTYALHRGFADLGPAMTDHWMIFLNADFILADGSLRNLLDHLIRGARIVASPSYCVIASEVMPKLLKRVDPKTTTLSMSSREMAKIALAHRHNTIRGKTVNQKAFHIRYMEQFYWQVDDATLLGHQMPVAIVGMRPERYVVEPNSYWDYGLIKEFCPSAEPDVIGDSDEFLMVELREQDVAHDQIQPGWPEARELGERMISWVTPYQRDFAHYPLTLHAADLPAIIDEGRRALRTFVEKVLSYAPSHLPSHLEHSQWTYHRTGFVEARHQFLSSRLGTLTETTEPPSHLSKVDQAWWKIDGKQKCISHQRMEATEAMNHQRNLIQRTMMEEVARQQYEVDQQFLDELTSNAAKEPSNPFFSSHCFETLERVSLQRQVQERKQRLEAELEAVDSYYSVRIRTLEQELEKLDVEYALLIGKVLIDKVPSSAAVPFLRMQRGSAGTVTRHHGSLAGRVAREIYYRLFGAWPRVTKLSPYWGALRHLHRLTEGTAARGAKDVLYVGDRSSIFGTIVNLPGLHAWMSLEGLMTGSMGGTFAQPPQFDLCICDLEFADLARFSEIYAAVRRFIRPGGTIIGFHLNGDAAQLSINQNELAKELSNIPPARIYYAGSARMAKLLQAFRSALSVPRSLSVMFLGRMVIRLGLLAPQVWFSNVAEARLSKQRQWTPPAVATSITTEITLPDFEGDDGTVEYAKNAGIYIDGVEAPVTEERLITPGFANPPGTAVILTFGQSNAANSGEERYAARGPVNSFNIFDMKFYRAIDPLPGASTDCGSVWGRLGDKLIDAGVARSVLIVPIAFGGTYVEDWAPGGQCYRRLRFALHRLKWVGVEVDMLCWHQGEANANHTQMTADEYCDHFLSMLRGLREAGVKAPVYVALATLCEEAPHPFQNGAQIRLGQKKLISIRDKILPGPDTDMIGLEHRRDSCHFAASGQELAAQAWCNAITARPLAKRVLWAKYRLECIFASTKLRGHNGPTAGGP